VCDCCTGSPIVITAVYYSEDMVELFTGRMVFLFGALLEDAALMHLLNRLLLQVVNTSCNLDHNIHLQLQDPRDMVEIFTGRMAFLFGALLENPALVHLLNQLLLQATVSRHVAPTLLQYLVEHRLKDLQQSTSKVLQKSFSLDLENGLTDIWRWRVKR